MLQHLTFTLALSVSTRNALEQITKKEKEFKNLSAYMPIFHPLKADPEIKI